MNFGDILEYYKAVSGSQIVTMGEMMNSVSTLSFQ